MVKSRELLNHHRTCFNSLSIPLTTLSLPLWQFLLPTAWTLTFSGVLSLRPRWDGEVFPRSPIQNAHPSLPQNSLSPIPLFIVLLNTHHCKPTRFFSIYFSLPHKNGSPWSQRFYFVHSYIPSDRHLDVYYLIGVSWINERNFDVFLCLGRTPPFRKFFSSAVFVLEMFLKSLLLLAFFPIHCLRLGHVTPCWGCLDSPFSALPRKLLL